jgi:hypothetical protein
MTIKEDLQRALEYGKDPYFAAIQAQPAYQTTLQKLKDTRPDKAWIQSPFQLPRFSTPEFEAARVAYRAKYGAKINVPGFEDFFQWKLETPISNEDFAAHKYAQARGLPSPLSEDQLATLTRKKARYLRMLQAPEVPINRGATAILTAMDNANDALFTFAVLGQIATKIAPKVFGRAAPIFGWAQGAADVLNLFNVAAMLSKKAYSTKRLLEKNLDRNPFHKKFWTERTARFGKRWPGFGELLQVPQVTQSMFGVGLCLGGIMGMMNDALTIGTEQVLQFAVNVAVTARYPSAYRTIWADAIDSANLVWYAKDYVDAQTLANVTLAASFSLETLIPTWIQVDTPEFLEIMHTAGSRRKKVKNPITKYVMDQSGIDPEATPTWPIFDSDTVPLDELALTYGPIITENFQAYLSENEYTPEGKITGEAASDLHGSIIAALSDDHVAQVSQTAIAGAVKDMSIASLLIPPGTSQATIEKLGDWIMQYERDHGSQPSVKDIQIKGIGLGINWTRRYPNKLSGKAEEIWPGWQAVQDQVHKIFTLGNE